MAGPIPEDMMEALRPKSVQELHASVAAAGRRKPLPPVVGKLQQFITQRQACEQRCISRLREQAVFEASLLPAPASVADDSSNKGGQRELEEQAREHIGAAVRKRFAGLENQCSVLCGKRLAHMVSS
eukprot:TRINITY_DN23918_c0_g2_i1.p3 TRINITY_DN23918_c0_g2~~TRINITY_DN23918_c0_g2_i1.p3  ORF type:complete len:127 (-),score=34.23 TRINITY_DN23918_c0_g2_i1:118-498(-)